MIELQPGGAGTWAEAMSNTSINEPDVAVLTGKEESLAKVRPLGFSGYINAEHIFDADRSVGTSVGAYSRKLYEDADTNWEEMLEDIRQLELSIDGQRKHIQTDQEGGNQVNQNSNKTGNEQTQPSKEETPLPLGSFFRRRGPRKRDDPDWDVEDRDSQTRAPDRPPSPPQQDLVLLCINTTGSRTKLVHFDITDMANDQAIFAGMRKLYTQKRRWLSPLTRLGAIKWRKVRLDRLLQHQILKTADLYSSAIMSKTLWIF